MERQIKARPLFARIIVFSVPVQRKLENSLLFQPNTRRGTFASCQPVWIVATGPDVVSKLGIGLKGFINDNFELEPSDLDLWEDLQHDERFSKLKEFVDRVDGEVTTQVIHEDSLLAIDD